MMHRAIIDSAVNTIKQKLEWQIVYGMDFWLITDQERLLRVMTKQLEVLLAEEERHQLFKSIVSGRLPLT